MTTNPERLSDEDLDYLVGRYPVCCDESRCIDKLLGNAIAELRSLRALLAAPHHCGWDQPRAVDGMVSAEWLGDDVNPDEAIALGAALVRAGIAARGGR